MSLTETPPPLENPGAVRTPFKISDPERIPAQRYYDKGFFDLENERLWPHVWQMACRLEEIPNVGDWVDYKILDKSVIVARSKDGVNAFHNACRHRGVPLTEGKPHGNCEVQGFTCPFHGWRWSLEGQNTFVYGRHMFSAHQLDQADLALRRCRTEIWAGCVFINFDDSAPSLRDCLGSLTDRLDARNVENLKVDWWRATVLPVNWKLAMEAFMEGYHVMRTHPQLHALTVPEMTPFVDPANNPAPSRLSSKDYITLTIQHLVKLHEGMAGMVSAREAAIAESLKDMEAPGDIRGASRAFYMRLMQEITTQGRAENIPVPSLTEIAVTHPVKAVEFIFPNYFLLPMFSAMASYRVRPLGPETCLFEMWSLALFPDNEERAAPRAPLPTAPDDPTIPEIPRQDYSNLPQQQRGLHAQGFDFMRLSKDVEGMMSNYQRLIDAYLEGAPPLELARATQVVCSGYDAPILDIGV